VPGKGVRALQQLFERSRADTSQDPPPPEPARALAKRLRLCWADRRVLESSLYHWQQILKSQETCSFPRGATSLTRPSLVHTHRGSHIDGLVQAMKGAPDSTTRKRLSRSGHTPAQLPEPYTDPLHVATVRRVLRLHARSGRATYGGNGCVSFGRHR
jgi:hypothetical protein